jgi:hypothetical protein
MGSGRPASISRSVAGMLVVAYVCMLLTVAWSLGPDYGDGDPTTRAVLIAQIAYPLLWLGVSLAWAGDVLLSRRGEVPPDGRGFTVGRLRFFHGPPVTVVCAASIVFGLLTATQ